MGDTAPAVAMQFYIDRGVDVNAQDVYGMTPLHYAVRAQNPEGVDLLLSAGADPNITERDNKKPIRIVLAKIPLEIDMETIKVFLKHGSNPYEENKYGVSIYNALEDTTETRGRDGKITKRPYISEMIAYIDEHYPRSQY